MQNTEKKCAGDPGIRGFTYIGLLIAVALIGVGLAAVGQVSHTSLQREKERELLFIGNEFKKAITRYYDSTPGAEKHFPESLDDLLLDRRYPVVRRYLRRIYVDPMTGSPEWGYVKGPGDTIMGVHSLSVQAPYKTANFPGEYTHFEKAKSYADWRFVHAETGRQGKR
jgi:type II secretory pathway pseudopilin PulG